MTASATLNAAIEAHLLTAEAVSSLAWAYAEKSGASPAYWVGGADNGCEYCADCVDAAVEAAKVEAAKANAAPREEEDGIFCDGGWDDRHTSDNMCSCETCGRILGYALTSEGLAMEVAELERQAEPVLPTPPVQAYATFAMIDAAVAELTYRREPEKVAIAIRAIDIACREIGITREMARQIVG